jgi:ribosomal protein L29
MKMKDVILKSEAELKALLAEYQSKVRELNFKVASRQLKNLRDLREAKRVVARILTHLSRLKS